MVLGMIGAGIELGRVARDTFFLQTIGADNIPIAYIVFAGIMVVASATYWLAAKRVSLPKLVTATLTLATLLFFGEGLLITYGWRTPELAYGLFSSVELAFLFVPMTVWAVANASFDVEEGEELLPSIAAIGLTGAVIGGLSARLLNHYIGPYNLLYISAGCFATALFMGLGGHIQNVTVRPEVEENETEKVKGSPWRQPLVRTLVSLAFPMWVLAYMIEYTYYTTVESAFPGEQDLAKFLALFMTMCSLLALLVQIAITPRLVAKRGPAATCFLYPAALAVAAVCTLAYTLFPVAPGETGGIAYPMLLVLVARFLDLGLFQSIYESTVHVLYFAVPKEARTGARALVSGILFPLSIACAGLVLVWLRQHNEPTYNVAFCSVVIGFLVLIMAMDIGPEYLRALLMNTKSDDNRARAALLDEIGKLSLSESRQVLLQTLEAPQLNEAKLAARLLAKDYDYTLIEDLAEVLHSLHPEVRHELEQNLPDIAVRELRSAQL
jgi:ATP/ADP translocase